MNITLQNGRIALVMLALSSFVLFGGEVPAIAYSGGWHGESRSDGWYAARWGGSLGEYPVDLIARLRARISELENRVGANATMWRGEWRDTRWGRGDVSGVEVATCDPDEITKTRATFCGRVSVGDARYVDVWFEFSHRDGSAEYTSRLRFDTTDDEDSFEATVYDLEPGKEYWVRAVARDAYGNRYVGNSIMFETDGGSRSRYYAYEYNDDPNLVTHTPYDITDDSARLYGSVAMRDGTEGTVFFLYGTDRNELEDAVHGAENYQDVHDRYVEKVRVASGLDYDEYDSYEYRIRNLDTDTRYYVAIGLAYEDASGDARVMLGPLRSFVTRD